MVLICFINTGTTILIRRIIFLPETYNGLGSVI